MTTVAARQKKYRERKKLIGKHGQGVKSDDILVTVNDEGTARVWYWTGSRWRLEGMVMG